MKQIFSSSCLINFYLIKTLQQKHSYQPTLLSTDLSIQQIPSLRCRLYQQYTNHNHSNNLEGMTSMEYKSLDEQGKCLKYCYQLSLKYFFADLRFLLFTKTAKKRFVSIMIIAPPTYAKSIP